MEVWAFGRVNVVVRLAAVLLVGVAVGGCGSTHTVSRSDPEALARLTEALAGDRVQIRHVTAEGWGTDVRVARDSTRWRSGRSVRVVPTKSVRAFVVNPALMNPSSATMGVAAGVMLGAAGCSRSPGIGDTCYIVALPMGALLGAMVFDMVEGGDSKRVEYRLVR